jgi:selenoprotein W-related protein
VFIRGFQKYTFPFDAVFSVPPWSINRRWTTRHPRETPMTRQPRIEIVYCTQCRWLLRAAWMAQELLTTFSEELGEVALAPATGGLFEIRLGEDLLWSRHEQGRFPEIKELKQLVRDRVAPGKDLGHSDRP